jgi:hypothetical protein
VRTAVFDQVLILALLLGCGAFALAVWLGQPAVPFSREPAPAVALTVPYSGTTSSANVARGAILHPLAFPGQIDGVDLAAMPDRLANEPPPAALQRVITVRGIPGLASVSGPAMILWTESGIAYWLTSPTKSIDELIQIASDMR